MSVVTSHPEAVFSIRPHPATSSTSWVVSTGASIRRSSSSLDPVSIRSPNVATRYVTTVVGAIPLPVE